MINKARLGFWLNLISWIVIVVSVPVCLATVFGAVRRQADVRKGTAEILAAIDRVRSVPDNADAVAMLVACASSTTTGLTCNFDNSQHRIAIQAHYDRPRSWFYILPVQDIHLVGVIYFDQEVMTVSL